MVKTPSATTSQRATDVSPLATTPALRGLNPDEQAYTVTDDDVAWMQSKVQETPAAIGVVLAVCFVVALIWGIQDAVGFLFFPFGVGLSAGLFALSRQRLLQEGALRGIPPQATKQLHWKYRTLSNTDTGLWR